MIRSIMQYRKEIHQYELMRMNRDANHELAYGLLKTVLPASDDAVTILAGKLMATLIIQDMRLDDVNLAKD